MSDVKYTPIEVDHSSVPLNEITCDNPISPSRIANIHYMLDDKSYVYTRDVKSSTYLFYNHIAKQSGCYIDALLVKPGINEARWSTVSSYEDADLSTLIVSNSKDNPLLFKEMTTIQRLLLCLRS
jgi:hypothetical protein